MNPTYVTRLHEMLRDMGLNDDFLDTLATCLPGEITRLLGLYFTTYIDELREAQRLAEARLELCNEELENLLKNEANESFLDVMSRIKCTNIGQNRAAQLTARIVKLSGDIFILEYGSCDIPEIEKLVRSYRRALRSNNQAVYQGQRHYGAVLHSCARPTLAESEEKPAVDTPARTAVKNAVKTAVKTVSKTAANAPPENPAPAKRKRSNKHQTQP